MAQIIVRFISKHRLVHTMSMGHALWHQTMAQYILVFKTGMLTIVFALSTAERFLQKKVQLGAFVRCTHLRVLQLPGRERRSPSGYSNGTKRNRKVENPINTMRQSTMKTPMSLMNMRCNMGTVAIQQQHEHLQHQTLLTCSILWEDSFAFLCVSFTFLSVSLHARGTPAFMNDACNNSLAPLGSKLYGAPQRTHHVHGSCLAPFKTSIMR